MQKWLACVMAALLAAGFPVQAAAEHEMASEALSEREQLVVDIHERAIIGPKVIDLGEEGVLNLPRGMKFIAKDDANKLMEMFGNAVSPQRYGLIFPDSEEELAWWFDLEYTDSGYIKDDDAKDWDVDAMLQSLKEGTEEQNRIRRSKDIAEVEVTGWIQKPAYDDTTHRLVWSVAVQEKNMPSDSEASVNYNTFVLGRKGYINLTLITDTSLIEQYKPLAMQLLNDIEFKPGLRYTDFDSSTDKVAEYGLAALIGGVAAKKLGLFAALGVLLAKFGKVIVLGAAALIAAVRVFFKRSKPGDEA